MIPLPPLSFPPSLATVNIVSYSGILAYGLCMNKEKIGEDTRVHPP